VHANLHGASSCIIKNPTGAPIPPVTLSQAGTMTVCRSAAWAAKVVTSAYWVYSDQVSKTAQTGEYLVTGSFVVRGKKNFLPPNPLVMGLAILFKVDESCLAKHIEDRKIKLEEADFEKYGLSYDPEPEQHREELKEEIDSEEKKLRKFERTKLKKEQKEKKEQEVLLEKEVTKLESTVENTEINDTPTAVSTLTVSAELDKVENTHESASDVKHKAKLSAAQRKKLKQGIPLEQQSSLPKQVVPQPKLVPVIKPPVKQPVRGKKGKLKKIKEKYKDQDEEERKLRMEILAKGGVIEENSEDSDEVQIEAEPEEHKTDSTEPTEPTEPTESITSTSTEIEDITELKEKEKAVDSDDDNNMDAEKISRRKANREAKEKRRS